MLWLLLLAGVVLAQWRSANHDARQTRQASVNVTFSRPLRTDLLRVEFVSSAVSRTPETLTRCAGAIVDDAGCAWFVTRSRTDAIVERFRPDGTSVCAALVPFASLAPNKTAGVSSVSLDVSSSLAFVAVQARLVAIHVDNCSVFWNVTVPDFELGNKTCASPTVAEGVVYLAGTSRLHAFAMADGKHLWNSVVIGGEEAESLAPFAPSYCKRTVVIGSMSGLPNATRLWAFDAATGAVLWNFTQDGKGDTWGNVMLDKDCKNILVGARNNVVVLDRRWGVRLDVALTSVSMTVSALMTLGNESSFVSVAPYVRAHLAARQAISLSNVTANGAHKYLALPQPESRARRVPNRKASQASG